MNTGTDHTFFWILLTGEKNKYGIATAPALWEKCHPENAAAILSIPISIIHQRAFSDLHIPRIILKIGQFFFCYTSLF
jgi:hypothetical protein